MRQNVTYTLPSKTDSKTVKVNFQTPYDKSLVISADWNEVARL